ncbi:uncharacterized protein BJ171DRAFT_4607 [Polychytrium aggregatum]|uniref:uncharacterized protein n=1 Tax=Polychytrium aggregatum TaxID=110093 RepID=UPI0022FF2462|nr:uncharacterized protein BJ171DRAFT_4607 [Polychytrium aggregatum]KAI9209633.1 hypothetical protein BJ171DRAFT_4607 [Polychytrium aggregatum]
MSKTARKIASPRMVALTPMFYMQSVQQAFYNATFPLFIASFHDPNTDLSIKLYLAGTLALASSCVALVLTKVGYRLRSLHLLSAVWASQALALLLVLFLRPVNNLAALFPIGIILGVTDAVIRTQNFILINEMFPEAADTPSAFACFNFHQSLGLGIFFISSKYLLGPDRVPNMAVWVPLQMGIFLIAVIGVGMGQRWYSPRSQHATSAPLEEVVKIEEDSLGIALDDTIATRDSSKM